GARQVKRILPLATNRSLAIAALWTAETRLRGAIPFILGPEPRGWPDASPGRPASWAKPPRLHRRRRFREHRRRIRDPPTRTRRWHEFFQPLVAPPSPTARLRE